MLKKTGNAKIRKVSTQTREDQQSYFDIMKKLITRRIKIEDHKEEMREEDHGMLARVLIGSRIPKYNIF